MYETTHEQLASIGYILIIGLDILDLIGYLGLYWISWRYCYTLICKYLRIYTITCPKRPPLALDILDQMILYAGGF